MLTIMLAISQTIMAPVQDDYTKAYYQARREHKMLLVSLGKTTDLTKINPGNDYILVNIQLNAERGPGLKLRDDQSISQNLSGDPGVFVVDLKHPERQENVVSALPSRHCSQEKVQALVDLPNGTLSQRTLIWAVKIHPERPQSTCGYAHPSLLQHCESHSSLQASNNRQFHASNWISIGETEIVAESWPWNYNIADAAIDIVNCWRQSPDHWGAVNSDWQNYGYDMKHSGYMWFATGIFGR